MLGSECVGAEKCGAEISTSSCFRFTTSDGDSDGRGSTLQLSRSNGTSVEHPDIRFFLHL